MAREHTWLVVWENVLTGEFLEHRDGVPWHDAPLPRRWHACYAQTRGFVLLEVGPATVKRCACGGVDIGDGWFQRGSRVK